jgi:hypothetical protein
LAEPQARRAAVPSVARTFFMISSPFLSDG